MMGWRGVKSRSRRGGLTARGHPNHAELQDCVRPLALTLCEMGSPGRDMAERQYALVYTLQGPLWLLC